MNIILDKLKNDTLSGIFELTGKSWMPVVVASILYVVLSNLIVMPYLLSSIGLSEDRVAALQQMSSDPVGMQREMENMFETIKSQFTTEVIIVTIVGMLVLTLVSCWVYYVAFRTMKDVVDGDKPDIGGILSSSFNGKVFNLFLSSLATTVLFMLLYFVAIVVIGLLASISGAIAGLIGFSAFIFLFAYMIRFMLSWPILAMEDVSVIDSLKLSVKAIPMGKAFKYLLIGFLAMIVLFIVFLVVGLIIGLLSAIPVVGTIFSLVGNIITSGLTVTLISALMMALYYKYRATDLTEGSIEDHLLYEN